MRVVKIKIKKLLVNWRKILFNISYSNNRLPLQKKLALIFCDEILLASIIMHIAIRFPAVNLIFKFCEMAIVSLKLRQDLVFINGLFLLCVFVVSNSLNGKCVLIDLAIYMHGNNLILSSMST